MYFFKKFKKHGLLFTIGAIGYALIEILFRGRTHWSMMIAGGLSFIMFSAVAEKFRGKPLIFKAGLVALGVTAIEFIFGIIFNILLKMDVWDYSNMPFNLLGQICPTFTLMWGALGLLFVPLADIVNRKIKT